jgi:hypothetical protein
MIYDELIKAVLDTNGYLGATSNDYWTAEQIVDAVVLKLKKHFDAQIKHCEEQNEGHHRGNDWGGCDFCDEREHIIEDLQPPCCIGYGEKRGSCTNPIYYNFCWMCENCFDAATLDGGGLP